MYLDVKQKVIFFYLKMLSLGGLDIYIAILHSAQSFRFLYTLRKKNSLSSILLKGKLCETDTTVIEYIYFVINSNIKVCMISKKYQYFIKMNANFFHGVKISYLWKSENPAIIFSHRKTVFKVLLRNLLLFSF